jgi:hypothetical protein
LLPCPFKTLIAAKSPSTAPSPHYERRDSFTSERQVAGKKKKNVKGRHYEAWEKKKEKNSPTA